MGKILGIIPARYASSRFPGKPLVEIHGKSMVQRVYEQCSKANALNKVIVATDNLRIAKAVSAFGGEAVMTDVNHHSGTDRCYEALLKVGLQYDYVINIQGDEPVINPGQIDLLTNLLDGNTELATLAKRITNTKELYDSNVVKVVFDIEGQALLFSRSTIPHIRNTTADDWLKRHSFYKHIGIYAYRNDILKDITNLKPSALEISESLEQLRWLENGYKIKVAKTQFESIGIDTPEDLRKLKGLV
ncbi:MAG: 3-deoxy-manno-octulosonate cytidylyltransferase [Bacteroidota bacterium]